MVDLTALYRDDVTPDERNALYQELVDSGMAWRLEGHVGRTAHDLIQMGAIMLGPERRTDFYGNVVPSRHDIEPGEPGSEEYMRNQRLAAGEW